MTSNEPTTPEGRRRWALQVLGLTGTPTRRQITSAYRRGVRATHPDSQGGQASPDVAATDRFADVVAAYHLLTSTVPGVRVGIAPGDATPREAPAGRRPPSGGWAARRQPPLVAGPVTFVPARRGRGGGRSDG